VSRRSMPSQLASVICKVRHAVLSLVATSRSLSARRRARATMVKMGLEAPYVGKTEHPATKRLLTEWTRQLGSTTPSRGFVCILVVPRWWLLPSMSVVLSRRAVPSTCLKPRERRISSTTRPEASMDRWSSWVIRQVTRATGIPRSSLLKPKVTRDSRLGACSACARQARTRGPDLTRLIARPARSRVPIKAFRVCQPMSAIRGRRATALRKVDSDRTALEMTAAGRGKRKKATFKRCLFALHFVRHAKRPGNLGAVGPMKVVELIYRCPIPQHHMSGVERQPLGEVPPNEVMLIAETTPVVRCQQEACVLDPASGQHNEPRAYHNAAMVAAHRNNAFQTPTGWVDPDLSSTRLEQQTHVGGRREDIPSIVEGGRRELENRRLDSLFSSESASAVWQSRHQTGEYRTPSQRACSRDRSVSDQTATRTRAFTGSKLNGSRGRAAQPASQISGVLMCHRRPEPWIHATGESGSRRSQRGSAAESVAPSPFHRPLAGRHKPRRCQVHGRW
jgi:hypothetical protein